MSQADTQLKHLLVVYHSMTGAALQLATAAVDGAGTEPTVRCTLVRAADCGPVDVLGADGIIIVSPEYLASMAGQIKDFFDRSYYPVLGKIDGRPCAIVVCAGSDGLGAVRQLQRILTGWRLRQIAEPLVISVSAQTPDAILAPKNLPGSAIKAAQDLGIAFAAGLSVGIY